MQTTLLGLAIAFIVALLAALAGPFVVDWNDYRGVFEKEASRLVGLDVRVGGKIDGRLLPSPRITLNSVNIGEPGVTGFRTRSIGIEFALGPLLRGDWHASEMRLVGPDVQIGIDDKGNARTPKLALNFDPDALSIERLSVEDGRLALGDVASGGTLVLEKLWFNGDVRSLLGPIKGEGAFRLGGILFPYRLAIGRYDNAGTIKLHLNVDPSDYPMALEADGTLNVSGAQPQFEGTVNVARPVAIARGSGGVVQPWRAGGKLKVTPKGALMEQVELQYGSGELAARLTGTADFKFGLRPRFDGVLSGRQIDLDRAMASSDGARVSPAHSIRQLVAAAGAAFKPTIPVRLGVGIDGITLGGGNVQNLRGDIVSTASGWSLEQFEFRAPGLTQVRLSGQLSMEPASLGFAGPADIASSDPRVLVGWLQGGASGAVAAPRAFRARGEIALARDKIGVERLRATLDRETLTGRMAYRFSDAAKPARLEAELNAPELDIDAVQKFAASIAQGAAFERPREVSLALDIGRALLSGYEAKQASVRMRLDADALQIERLSVADFGGAAFSASGRIALGGVPSGSISLDLDAKDLTALTAAAGRYAPELTGRLKQAAPTLAPAKLHSTFTVESATAAIKAGVTVAGTAGALTLDLRGQATASNKDIQLSPQATTDVRVNGKLSSSDNLVLARLLGLESMLAIGKSAGELTFAATGSSLNDYRIESHWTGSDVDIAAEGTVTSLLGSEPKSALLLKVARADASGLRGGLAALAAPLPVSFTAKVSTAGASMRFDDIAGRVGASAVRGRVAVADGSPRRITGDLDIDSFDLPMLLAMSAGMPTVVQAGAWTWPSEPFGQPALSGYDGNINLKATRTVLTPEWAVRAWRAALRFGSFGIALEDMTGDFAGGQFKGALSLHKGSEGLIAKMQIAVDGADASALAPQAIRAPLTGKFDLELQAEGAGLSPATLIGSLHGAGTVRLDGARLAGLDPRVFDAVTRAAGDTVQTDQKVMASLAGRALEAGYLSVPRASGEIAISAGQLRISNMAMKGEDADAAVSGRLDLSDGSLDARLVLSGAVESGTRPSLFIALRGPAADPVRSLDVSALAGWLTMKSIERQAKQLQAIESQQPKAAPAAPKVQSPPLAPADTTQSVPALPPPITISPVPNPPKLPPRAQHAPVRKPAAAPTASQ